MKRILARVALCLLVCAIGCITIWAQGTAQISGTVKDQTGAVLPGVEVTATQTDTGVSRTTVTNETGSYVLPNLLIGPYKLEAQLPGFRAFIQTGIILQVNQSPVVNPVLEVGQVSEQVEVQANAALVETRSSSVGQVVENQRILELPLNGRQVTDLITLSGGAVSLGTGRNTGLGAPTLQIAGGLGYGIGYSLDGAAHSNLDYGGPLPLPFPDALQEFKVDTSGVSAEQGRSAGVSAVTKSGTNEFHGTLFEFVRNDLFNARSYFATKGSTLKRNQFGGVFGGPIKQSRVFFFGGYQGMTLRQDPADSETFLPTAAMLAGDWSAYASPGCNAGRPLTLRTPFVNNRIDPSQFSKAGLGIANKVLAQAPQPEDACGHVRYGRPTKTDEKNGLGRVDYQLSDKHSIFGRYMYLENFTPSAFALTPNNLLNSGSAGQENKVHTLIFGSTYLFGPQTVNSFRASASTVYVTLSGTQMFSICDVGAKAYCGFSTNRSVVNVTNGPSLGSTYNSNPNDHFSLYTYVLNDDVSLVRGAHQFIFGGSVSEGLHVAKYISIAAGRTTISTAVTGSGLGDLLTGKVQQYIQTGPQYVKDFMTNIALYAADTWKTTPKLTMNYGVRWEPYLPQRMVARGITNFDYDRFQQGIRSTVYPTAPPGLYYPGDPGHPGWKGSFNKLANFAPRIGLAWDVRGDGKTSIRASAAYSYAPVLANWREDPNDQNPWGNATRLVSPAGGLDDLWAGYPGGNPFPDAHVFHRFTQFGDYTSTPYDMQAPQSATFSLGIQRQLASDWLASASYLGTVTSHIWIQDGINPAVFLGLGSCTLGGVTWTPCSQAVDANYSARRRFTLERPNDPIKLGNIAMLQDTATMNYHGMLVSLQRRVSRGVNVNANYTWSHCIGDNADLTSSGPDAGEVFNKIGDRTYDRGDCNGDRRQLFNLTGVAQTPNFSNHTLALLASNWTFSTIYRRSSGSPLTILAGSDRALNGELSFFQGSQSQRGSQIASKAYSDQSGRPFTVWLDPTSFGVPALGEYGNSRRNSVVGPPGWSFDVALSRAFRFRESQRFEFRAEAFNLTNSFRPGNPNVTANNALFGQIRASATGSAGDPRIMQFALKYVF
jgi:Carboxypeptidase regulatory-like domain